MTYGTRTDLPTLGSDEGLPGRALIDREILTVASVGEKPAEIVELGFAKSIPRDVVYIPLLFQDNPLGVLVLGRMKEYGDGERELFNYLGSQISIALDNAILHNRVQEMSITDPLTDLFNRRYLNRRLDEEWARSMRHKTPISIILADVDNFKSVNDTYGHDKGDEVLKSIGKIFKSSVRKEDLVARYGGEEFVAVLTDTDSEQAAILAERLREKAENTKYPWMGRAATLSIGVASFPETKVNNYEQLIQAADQAMYKAKTSGKNRVVISAP